MGLSKRHRALAWEGLGWSFAAGLGLALLVSLALGFTREQDLKARLAAAEGRATVAARSLSVCEASSTGLRNALAAVNSATPRGAGGVMTSQDLLTRPATGADACARAFEAEALVREATR
jgi:hypothetical protein